MDDAIPDERVGFGTLDQLSRGGNKIIASSKISTVNRSMNLATKGIGLRVRNNNVNDVNDDNAANLTKSEGVFLENDKSYAPGWGSWNQDNYGNNSDTRDTYEQKNSRSREGFLSPGFNVREFALMFDA